MAITFDTPTSGNNINGPLTVAHTLSAANLLIVCINTFGNGSGPTPSWNGTAMTKYISDNSGTIGAAIWYILSPALGSFNVTVPFPNLGPLNSSANFVEVVGLNNVDLTNPFGTSGSNLIIGSSMTTGVTSTQANSVILDSTANTGNFAPTKGGSQTIIATQSNNGNPTNGGGGGASSYQQTTTVGGYSMAWSGGVRGTIWDTVYVEILPAIPSTGGVNSFFFG